MRNPVQATFFSTTSKLTKYFPRLGARLLDASIYTIAANQVASALVSRLNQQRLKRVRSFRRFLVHPDIHIGDAIMGQAVVTALRDFFPNAQVDFVTNQAVLPLLDGNPEVHCFFPIYSGGTFPPDSELKKVGELLNEGDYDLCINMNPFLPGKRISKKCQVFDFTTHAPSMLRNERTVSEANHIAFQYRRFVQSLMGRAAAPKRQVAFNGLSVRLSDKAFEEAGQFVRGLPLESPLAILNADTASAFTRIPFPYQSELAALLLEENVSLFVGAGHTEKGIGARLLESLPMPLRSKARLIPAEMSLEGFAALTDHCDLFITGDTGPMHVAAARKISRTGNYPVRNRSAVLCLFGATQPRMSGYDSFQKGYLPSNQEAPSWTVVADSPCRNITCMNKLFKTCQTIRCFETMDIGKVKELVTSHLKQSSSNPRFAG